MATSLQRLEGLAAEHIIEEGYMHKCIICGWPFKLKYDAKLHVESKHFPTDNGYHCGICDKYFNTFKAMKNHNTLYHKKSQYVNVYR